MLTRKFGAVNVPKTLSKGPGLVRFKIVWDRNEYRPWPTGSSSKTMPIHGTWRHKDKNYTIPITIHNVPNDSDAYTMWPRLKAFMPALHPRARNTVNPGGGRGASVATQLSLMPYMYNDLGVMVYEGPNAAQVQRIGDILKYIVRHESRVQHREWNVPVHKKVLYDKWNVYRLQVDAKTHIDWQLKPERGLLHPNGLDELTDMAVEKWREEWQAKRMSEGKDGPPPIKFAKDTKKMWLLRNTDGLGLYNETINGPRLTSVDAYVATTVFRKLIWVDVELHTVGTKRFLGSASFQYKPGVDQDRKNCRLEKAKEVDHDNSSAGPSPAPNYNEDVHEVLCNLEDIYEHEAPASIRRQQQMAPDVTNKLWKLEKRIWGTKLRQEKKERRSQRKSKRGIPVNHIAIDAIIDEDIDGTLEESSGKQKEGSER